VILITLGVVPFCAITNSNPKPGATANLPRANSKANRNPEPDYP